MNYQARDVDNRIKPLCAKCRVSVYTKTGAYCQTFGPSAYGAQCANCGAINERGILSYDFTTEFNRCKAAKRGSVRDEVDDYVLLLHCSSYTTYEMECIHDNMKWFGNVHCYGVLLERADFDSFLSAETALSWFTGVIYRHLFADA